MHTFFPGGWGGGTEEAVEFLYNKPMIITESISPDVILCG